MYIDCFPRIGHKFFWKRNHLWFWNSSMMSLPLMTSLSDRVSAAFTGVASQLDLFREEWCGHRSSKSQIWWENKSSAEIACSSTWSWGPLQEAGCHAWKVWHSNIQFLTLYSNHLIFSKHSNVYRLPSSYKHKLQSKCLALSSKTLTLNNHPSVPEGCLDSASSNGIMSCTHLLQTNWATAEQEVWGRRSWWDLAIIVKQAESAPEGSGVTEEWASWEGMWPKGFQACDHLNCGICSFNPLHLTESL